MWDYFDSPMGDFECSTLLLKKGTMMLLGILRRQKKTICSILTGFHTICYGLHAICNGVVANHSPTTSSFRNHACISVDIPSKGSKVTVKTGLLIIEGESSPNTLEYIFKN